MKVRRILSETQMISYEEKVNKTEGLEESPTWESLYTQAAPVAVSLILVKDMAATLQRSEHIPIEARYTKHGKIMTRLFIEQMI